MIRTKMLLLVILLSMSVTLTASGPLGIYGIIEKVVFEPDEKTPQRIQVWGAFAYSDGVGTSSAAASPVKRGYLYFQNLLASPTVATEWRDLKSVAGTGQAVAFGRWIYIGGFTAIHPDEMSRAGIYEPSGGAALDMRVRPATETPSKPAEYVTNSGIVKLSSTGSHADLVKLLMDALKPN